MIAIIWAPQIGKFEKLWDYLQMTLAWFCPPIVALFVMGLFFKRVNTKGALAGIIIGGSLTVFLILIRALSIEIELGNFLYVAFLHFVISYAAILLFSMSGVGKSEAELANVVWTSQEFNKETLELKQLPWYKNYRIQAMILVLLVILILLKY